MLRAFLDAPFFIIPIAIGTIGSTKNAHLWKAKSFE